VITQPWCSTNLATALDQAVHQKSGSQNMFDFSIYLSHSYANDDAKHNLQDNKRINKQLNNSQTFTLLTFIRISRSTFTNVMSKGRIIS
jgi:hypothetical protein